MIRSLAFTTQGRLHTRDIDRFLMPTLLADTNLFLWVDLESATPEETKFILEDVFHFHPLSIEDCVAESPWPKVDEYTPREEDKFTAYLFIVIHGIDYSRESGVFKTREIDFFLGKNFLVTYHVGPSRSVLQMEDRAIKGTMAVARAPDRLAHTLLDTVVENYKPALEEFGLEIASLEQMALQDPCHETLNRILRVKKEVRHLLQIMGPERDVIARFAHGEFKLIRPHVVPYFRDVYDSVFQVFETARGYSDSLIAIVQVYLNMSANQTGEVVKLLTLITAITTPFMMIGTWYGMNFQNMPELKWKYGYLTATLTMLISTLGTYWYFKKKKWF